MNNRIAAAALSGLSIVMLNGCAPWVNDVIHLGQDVKKTSDEYVQEKHEERVEDLNQEYEEFLKSPSKTETDDEEAKQSIVIVKDDIDADPEG